MDYQDAFAGQWPEIRGKAKFEWLKLTEDDLNQVDGRVDMLVGALRKRYGYSNETAATIVEDWLTNLMH